MRTSEWIVVWYVGYLMAIAAVRPVRARDLRRLLVGGATLAAAVIGLASAPASRTVLAARDWMSLAYILGCYHLTSTLFFAPQPAMEGRFAAFDARVQRAFRMPASIARAPRVVAEYLEAAYFACYAALPAGYAALRADGHAGDADRYWSFVLLATLGSYGMLPWIRTRAPWSLEPPGPMDRRPVVLRDLNRFFIRHASIQVNTFPSGHTASALAAALAIVGIWPAAGAVFLLLAASIAAATFVGRYHYAGDALAAVATALAAWAVVAHMAW